MIFPSFKSDSQESRFSFPRLNWMLLLCAAALLCYGVLFVRSATSIRVGPVHDIWLKMLFQWIPLGLIAHVIFAAVDYRKWVDHAWILYGGSIVLLILVLIPGIGTVTMGARRWLFGIFQPSEAAKLAVIPFLAFLLTRSAIQSEIQRFWATLFFAALPALLVLIQPDMGSSLPFGVAAIAMLYVSGCARKVLFRILLTGIILISIFLGAILIPETLPPEKKAKVERITDDFIFDHWKSRILVFVFPDRDPLGAGWNKRQSEIAVGSGAVWGKGYKKGTQNILGYLPASVSSSDFIFSVVAEETGFAGSLLLIALYAGLLGSICVSGFLCRDLVGRLICTGITATLFTHIFVNLAMTIGKMPITGIPLPLVSYGGTFTITTLALLGLAHSVSIHRHKVDPFD